MVDAKYRFLDIYVGWPGSVHDARVFAHSPLYHKVMQGELLPNECITINGTDVPLYFVGDAAYPLQTWLMKPFQHNSILSDDKKRYNYSMSKVRIVVENAFGRLKARW